jgi:uncharacterized membrane protein (DUF485 family)
MFIGALFPLAMLGAIGYGLYRVLAARKPRPSNTEVDLREQVVRVFRLGLLFVSVVLAAEGIAGLIAEVLPRGDDLVQDSTALAQALAFTIVGVPALFGLARWTRQRLDVDPDELPSVVWAAYLGGTLTVALIMTMVSLQRTLEWVFGLEPLDGRAAGRTVVWGAVLVVHWDLNRRRPLLDQFRAPEERTPWYLIVGSLVGLISASVGTWGLLRAVLRPIYDTAVADVLVAEDSTALIRAAISAAIGLTVWSWFWLRHGQRSPRTERWNAYVLLAGVLGGLVATLISAGVLVHSVLQWFFGDPSAATAAAHFDLLPGVVSSLVVGFCVWLLHRRTLGAAPVHRNEADRVYTYLVAFVGLAVCAAAVTLVVAAFIDAVVDTDVANASVANPIVLAVSFMVVGLPVWLVFWRRAEHNADADVDELRSPSRRLYLLVTIGISAAVALVSMVVLLTNFLEDVTAGELSSGSIRAIRVPVGLVLSATAVAGYHFMVYRDDRRATPTVAPATRRATEVVLISDLGAQDASEVAHALGGRVVRFDLNVVGPPPGDEALARAVEEIGALTTSRALVTVRDGTIGVEALRD